MMNSVIQNQDFRDFQNEIDTSIIEEMNSSSTQNNNSENDQNNSESRPFCFQQLKTRSENSSRRNFSNSANDEMRNTHAFQRLTAANLFQDNLGQSVEDESSSSDGLSDHYSEENTFVDIRSFFNDVSHRLDSLVNLIINQEISDNTSFSRKILLAQNAITDHLTLSHLLKEEQLVDLQISNLTNKSNKIKKKEQQLAQNKEEIIKINEELSNLDKQKSDLIKETDSIRSENQNLYLIPILNRPVIPSQRRSPYLREINKIRELRNDIERQEKMLDYQKHEMDREIAILKNHVSSKESEVLNLLDQISKAESRNIVVYFPCSVFSNSNNFSNTNTNSSLSSTPKIYSIPHNPNPVKVAKPRKLAQMAPQNPPGKGKSKKKALSTRFSYEKDKNTSHNKKKDRVSVHEPSTLIKNSPPRSPRSINKHKKLASFSSTEVVSSRQENSNINFADIQFNTNNDDIDQKYDSEEPKTTYSLLQEDYSETAPENQSDPPNSKGHDGILDNLTNEKEDFNEVEPQLPDNHSSKAKQEGFPSFNQSSNQSNQEGFPSFNQNSSNSNQEGFPSFNQNSSNSNQEGFPSFNQSSNQSNQEGFPSFNQSSSNSNQEGFPSFNQSSNQSNQEGFPSFNANTNNSANQEGFPSLKQNIQSSNNSEKEGFPGMKPTLNENSSDKVSFPSASKPKSEGLHISFAADVMKHVENKKKREHELMEQYFSIAQKVAKEVIVAAIEEQKQNGTNKEGEEDEFAIYNQPKEEDEFSIYNEPKEEKGDEKDIYSIYNQPPEEDTNEVVNDVKENDQT